MTRAVRTAPWLFAAGAAAFATMVLVSNGGDATAARIVLVVVGIAACLIGWRLNRMPHLFVGLVAVGGVRVALLKNEGLVHPRVALGVAHGAITLIVGIAILAMLGRAVRDRRGALDTRDGIDLIAVSLAASLVSWILVASRLVADFDVSPGTAVINAGYLPLAVVIFTFGIDLLFTGLIRNRTMQLMSVAAAANLAGATTSGLHLVGVTWAGHHVQLAMFGAAFLLMCAGISHRDAPAIIVPKESDDGPAAYTPLRLVVSAACLLIPGVLVASLPAYGSADIFVRIALFAALVAAIVCRLFIAVQSHEQAQSALIERLHRDQLTNLPTRAPFIKTVAGILEETWRSEFTPTIIQLNLNRFKNINDSLGHKNANEVLVIVSDRLRQAAATFGGEVARSGGDDFVIVDGSTTACEQAILRVDAVRAALAEPVTVGDSSMFVTASFGVAVAPRNRTISAEELMRRADIANHRAKADGRNSVAVFDDSMQANLTHRMDVEHALHGAIGRNEMRLYYQPIVDIGTGDIRGFEALMRWQRTDGTIVSPLDFISIAEDTGIICELGAWALHEALGELRHWIDDGVVDPATTMSVNMSPRQIADANFAEIVRYALDETGMPPELLWLEMTESMMLDEPELAQSTLREIRDMGIRLALDDFGTGYSSLSLLQQFPIQRLKIDRAFVMGIDEPGNDRKLVRTIIAMAQSLGLDIVAEGVETVQQLQVLRDMSCDKAQGFLISRPVPPEAMRSTMVALNELTSLSLFGPPTGNTDDAQETATQPAAVTHAEHSIAEHSIPRRFETISNRPLGQPVF